MVSSIMRGQVMATPFPLSNRATDVKPGCKTQRITPTLRQVADLVCARTTEKEYTAGWAKGGQRNGRVVCYRRPRLVREGTEEHDGNTQEVPARDLVRVAMGDSSTQKAPARGLGRVSMEGSARGAPARGFVGEVGINSAQKAPARGLVRRSMEDNNAQGAPARGLVRVVMDKDNSAQGAPARGLVRVAMDEENFKVQGIPARGLVRVRTCIDDSPCERYRESWDREPSPDIKNLKKSDVSKK
ncbi:hypothetical protein PoB_005142700 [Plakobranchus ocellatus]|uniref:Uncharacterized protein n=1 Tax=Plakobranchus ocellatus TaxID=259542 RepID=A0AAV4C0P1_9GAST|nr:hypothetical protein PoB_005142700 [Plakobranchus ocellatus]